MKITKKQLREIIREEIKSVKEATRIDLWNLARGIEDVGLSLGEGVIKEEDIKWKMAPNALVNFLKHNTKSLDKAVKKKDAHRVKHFTYQIINGLTNALRGLNFESINEGGMGILSPDQTDVLHAIVMRNKNKNSKSILTIALKDPMFKNVDKKELLGYIDGAKQFVRYM